MDEKQTIDVLLVRSNLKILLKANESEKEDMWEFPELMVESVLTDKYLPSVRVISRQIGMSPLKIFVDFIDGDAMKFIRLRKERFLQFVDFIEAYCNECEKELLPSYQEAWKLLVGLVVLLNSSSDEFGYTSVDKLIHVHLGNTFRAFLFKIITIARLEEVVSDALYGKPFYDGERSFIKPQEISNVLDIDDLCIDLEVIEGLIRSMCNKTEQKDQFKFDIEKSYPSSMTIAELIRHVATIYIKNLE